jgi:hypothetical protein
MLDILKCWITEIDQLIEHTKRTNILNNNAEIIYLTNQLALPIR